MVYDRYNQCTGMVFAMTNETENKVVAIKRDSDGKLLSTKYYKTGGSGSNEQRIDPLQSQGSVILSECREFLFVVNAGSNSISSFSICKDRLILKDVVSSGGIFPNSLTSIGNIVYVTNVGDSKTPSNVVGFYISDCGCLEKIPYSERALSANDTQPGNIIVNPSGDEMAVSEKATNKISIFEVKCDGTLVGPVVNSSNGMMPFSSAYINDDILINTEAETNALSSYAVTSSGQLNTVSPSIQNNQLAVCWVVPTINNRYAFTSNTNSGTISIYRINPEIGTLTYLSSVASVPFIQESPIDAAIDKSGNYYYVLNAMEGSISVFSVENGGNELLLKQVYRDTQLPPIGSQGLAVL